MKLVYSFIFSSYVFSGQPAFILHTSFIFLQLVFRRADCEDLREVKLIVTVELDRFEKRGFVIKGVY